MAAYLTAGYTKYCVASRSYNSSDRLIHICMYVLYIKYVKCAFSVRGYSRTDIGKLAGAVAAWTGSA